MGGSVSTPTFVRIVGREVLLLSFYDIFKLIKWRHRSCPVVLLSLPFLSNYLFYFYIKRWWFITGGASCREKKLPPIFPYLLLSLSVSGILSICSILFYGSYLKKIIEKRLFVPYDPTVTFATLIRTKWCRHIDGLLSWRSRLTWTRAIPPFRPVASGISALPLLKFRYWFFNRLSKSSTH